MSGAIDPDLSRAGALRRAAEILARGGIAQAAGDARHLGLHALALRPTDLALRGEAPVGAAGARRLDDALARRLAGEPVARVLGEWDFYGLTFALGPHTLVPRPDTERLIETALAQPLPRTPRLLDLGTGSGCILVALLAALPEASGLGTDLSPEALATARANARAHGVAGRAAFACGRWCAPLAGPFDLIVSNPPYIARSVIATLDPEVRDHDPVAALDGGADGLDAYRAILADLAGRPGLLAPGGALVVEIGHDQGRSVSRLGREAGFETAGPVRDLAGHDRVVTFRPPSAGTPAGEPVAEPMSRPVEG